MSANKVRVSVFFSWLLVLLVPIYGIGAETYEDPATGMQFVSIKGGCFQMGSETGTANERPVHEVCVGDFFMGKYEETQGQWKRIMGDNPSFFSDCGDNCPVENLSWADAQDFIGRLNKKTGAQKYRLPTEAEWEYAARAGSQAKYSFGDDARDLDEYAWYKNNSANRQNPEVLYNNRLIRARPHPVGQKKPNSLGLYDMHGNVCEWVHDWYGEYRSDLSQNPMGPSSGTGRVYRGGGWDSDADSCRSAKRISIHLLGSKGDLGFRLVRTP
jgi:formylglycine-generating enzyme